MVLQMLARSVTWEVKSMALVANGAPAPVLRHMGVRRIALSVITGNIRRRCHDLVFEIRTHLDGGRYVRCRMFLIHSCQHDCDSIEELVWVRLVYGRGSAGRNRLADFFGRRSDEPSGNADKTNGDETEKNGRQPRPGSIRFHIFWVEFCAIIGADFFQARRFLRFRENN